MALFCHMLFEYLLPWPPQMAQKELRRLAAVPKILSLGILHLTPEDILSETDATQVLVKVF